MFSRRDFDDSSAARFSERMLNERVPPGGPRYEVLNFGVGGYSTHDEVAVLAAKALPLDPDLVIIDYHPNDPESEPVQPLHQVFHQAAWWEHWNLLRLLAYGRRWWGVAHLGHGSEYRYLASPDGPHWPTVLAAFDRARDLCVARHLPVIVCVFPTYSIPCAWPDYPYTDLHAQVLDAARAHGFTAIDILPAFAASGHTMSEIAVDTEHPGELGLEIAARAVADLIVARHQELLGRPPP